MNRPALPRLLPRLLHRNIRLPRVRVRPPSSTRAWMRVVAGCAVVLAGFHFMDAAQPGWHYGLPAWVDGPGMGDRCGVDGGDQSAGSARSSVAHTSGLRCGICRNDGLGRPSLPDGRRGWFAWQVGVWDGGRTVAGDRAGDMRVGVRVGGNGATGWWRGRGVVLW